MENLLEILGKIGFDWQVALANLVNFLIILYILKRFAFKPIGKLLEDRRKKIQEGLDNTQKTQEALLVAEARKEEIIKEAQDAGNVVLMEAVKSKNDIIDTAKEKAEIEAKLILEDAEKERTRESEIFRRQLQEEATELVLIASEKLLQKEIDKKKNDVYVKELIGSMVKES